MRVHEGIPPKTCMENNRGLYGNILYGMKKNTTAHYETYMLRTAGFLSIQLLINRLVNTFPSSVID